jgi:hypothetical protein
MNETQRCKNCKHWGNELGDNGRLKMCDSPKHIYAKNACWNDMNRTPDDGALIEYDEGWGMLAGPEFGCVNFEVKK